MHDMRTWIILLWALLLLSCEDTQQVIRPIPDGPFSPIESLSVKLYPQSSNSLEIRVITNKYERARIRVWQDDTLNVGELMPSQFNPDILQGVVQHDFPNRAITLRVELQQSNRDTLDVFTIPNYTHQHTATFQVKALIEFTGTLVDFDLTPQNEALFFREQVGNRTPLYRYDFASQTLEVLFDNFQGEYFRSISADQLLIGRKMLQDRTLGADSLAWYRYHMSIDSLRWIGFAREAFSPTRIVRNQIIARTPVASDSNAFKFDIVTGKMTYFSLPFSYLRDLARDNHWLDNQLIDVQTGKLLSFSFLPDEPNFTVAAYDNSSQLLIGYHQDETENPKRIEVYKSQQNIFTETDTVTKLIQPIYAQSPASRDIIFHQTFPNELGLRDGYYRVDLTSRQMQLIQHRTNAGKDYWINNRSFISIQNEGIYIFTR